MRAGRREGRSRLLPSLESQTVAFVDAARNSRHTNYALHFGWAGFRAYLRYGRNYRLYGQALGEVLVIASIEIPARYQGRGWFWRYCQLCLALVADAVVVEAVIDDDLREALARRAEFEVVNESTFVLRKARLGDWPLSFPAEHEYARSLRLPLWRR